MMRALGLLLVLATGAQATMTLGGGSVVVESVDDGVVVSLCSGERYRLDSEAMRGESPLKAHINTDIPTPGGAIVWTEWPTNNLFSWCPPERLQKIAEKQMRRPDRARRGR